MWKKGDKRTTYNVIYLDGATGRSMVVANVTSITRDREYPITKGTPKSKILYFTANPNGEAEVVTVFLRAQARLKKVKFDLDFSDIGIGRGASGNLVSKFPVRKIELKEAGVTLGARKVWYDETLRRLNADGRGQFLGDFKPDDKIFVLLNTGEYLFTGFDLSTHFDERMILSSSVLTRTNLSPSCTTKGRRKSGTSSGSCQNSARTPRASSATTNSPNSGSRPPCTIRTCASGTTAGSSTRGTARTTSSTCVASFR